MRCRKKAWLLRLFLILDFGGKRLLGYKLSFLVGSVCPRYVSSWILSPSTSRSSVITFLLLKIELNISHHLAEETPLLAWAWVPSIWSLARMRLPSFQLNRTRLGDPPLDARNRLHSDQPAHPLRPRNLLSRGPSAKIFLQHPRRLETGFTGNMDTLSMDWGRHPVPTLQRKLTGHTALNLGWLAVMTFHHLHILQFAWILLMLYSLILFKPWEGEPRH